MGQIEGAKKIKGHSIFRPRTTQNVAFTGTSARTAAGVGNFIQVVRVCATAACWIRVGNSTVVATTSDIYLPANTVDYLIVDPGSFIAAIQASAAGTLNVTECN